MMLRAFTSLLVILGLALGTTGCEKIKDFIEKAKDKAEKDQETKEGDNADAELGDKLQLYLICINTTSSSVDRAHSMYFRWIDDPEKGPTGKERAINGTLEFVNVSMCMDNIKKAKKAEPSLEKLEKAAEAFAEAVEKLEPINKEAYDYYKGKDYKDDGFKKGKDLHGKLAKGFEKFYEVDKKFREAFSKEKSELDERELERLKRLGEELAYRHQKFMIESRELVSLATDVEYDKIDEGAFKKQLDETQEILDDLDSYASKNAAEKNKVMMFDMFMSAAKDYMTAAKELHRRKRDKKEFTQQELQQMQNWPEQVTGTPAQVLDKFNTMIQRSNSMHWN